MPPHQTWTALVCVALFGCATGVEDYDWAAEPVINGAPLSDASAGPPVTDPGYPATSPVLPPIVVSYDGSTWGSDPGQPPTADASTSGSGLTPPDSSGTGQGGASASSDSSVSQPPSTPVSNDAGSPSTADAGTSTSGSFDAGTKPVDAGYTPPEAAPMCQVATCTNYCGLARRCCNASNQCACATLLGSCILPSIRP